ncbi:MAG: glycosyltransferase family 39 protein [Aggregatilineales bacterium]
MEYSQRSADCYSIAVKAFSTGRFSHKPWFVFASFLILLIAFGLRLWNLGTQSLWHDEAWSVFSAYHPLAWGELGTDPNAPPVFYLSLSVWLHLTGDSVWALRYWSVLIGVITTAVTAFVTRRFFGNGAAILAAFFVAVSPILWVYSQEIRGYVAMPLYTLLLLALAEQLLRAPSRRTWIWLALVEMLALYTQNLAVPLVAWLNCAVIGALTWQQEWRQLRTWLVVQIGLGIVYLPWLITQSPTGTPLNNPPPIAPTVIWDIWQSYFTGIKALLNADSGLTALMAVFGLVTLGALIVALTWRPSPRVYWLLSQVILLPIFELGIIWAAHIDFHPRYFVLGVPATLVLIAVGLDMPTKMRFPVWRIVPIGVALLAAAITAQMLRVTFSSPVYQHDDFRAIAEHYAQLSADDAIVIPYGWEPTLDYYSQKMGFKAQIVGIPLGSSWQTIVERLNAIHARHIEVLTWYQLPADLRGAYPCLLGASANGPATFTVNGLTTSAYDQPGPVKPQLMMVDPVSFSVFNIGKTWFVSNDSRACVITAWTLAQKTGEPFGVTAQLNNPLGWQIAQSSTDLRDDHQTPTQFWSVGQTGMSFNSLRFSQGLSPGNYPLVTGVYNTRTLRSLDILKNGAPSGQVLRLGTPTLTPADWNAPLQNAIEVSTWRVQVIDELGGPNAGTCILQPGQQYRVTTLWWTAHPAAESQSATIRLSGTGWQSDQTISIPANRHTTLTWAAFTLPADATGTAQLIAISPDGTSAPLRQCTLKPSDHLLNPPAIQTPVNVNFQGVGTLVGFDLTDTTVDHAGSFNLTLYWQSDETPKIPYTVFTHLLNAADQVIAQSDSPPNNGNRPTTGWVKSEYVIDPHTLAFNVQGQNYVGSATIEVGVYDPLTGQRVLLSNGADHILLPVSLTVK